MSRKLPLLASMFLVVAVLLTGPSLAVGPQHEPGVMELREYCGDECFSPRYAVFYRHIPYFPPFPELPVPLPAPVYGNGGGTDTAPPPPASAVRATNLTPKGAAGAGAAYFDGSTSSARSPRVRSAAVRYELVRVSGQLGL